VIQLADISEANREFSYDMRIRAEVAPEGLVFSIFSSTVLGNEGEEGLLFLVKKQFSAMQRHSAATGEQKRPLPGGLFCQ
jgi:hypothetical protein